jgi:hypothetical protein
VNDAATYSDRHGSFSGASATFNAATAPEPRYVKDTAHSLTDVYGDVNGADVADLHIRETDLLNNTSADFFL